MPPKKKDKGKLHDWMQCSLCGKLVSSQDAEVHSKSCDSDLGYVQGKVFHGKVVSARQLTNGDNASITQNIRDKDSVVWLATPTMQICNLSIGQPCVVNKVVVMRAWPLKPLQLSAVALPAQLMEDLHVQEGSTVTVEKFVPNENIVQSAVLQLSEPNDTFEKDEFLSFAASYLDGKFLTKGTPLTVRYFGHACQCYVRSMVCGTLSHPQERTNIEHFFSDSEQSPVNPQGQTPERHKKIGHSVGTTESIAHDDVNSSLCTSGQDMSDLISRLDISDVAACDDVTVTPKICDRSTLPNFVTPIKGLGQPPVDTSVIFAKVSSKLTTFSVMPTLRGGQSPGNGRNNFSLADVGGMKAQIEELKRRITQAQQPSSTNRCILVHGPAGTGKTLLVQALTSELGLNTVHIAGTDIWSKLFGEAESNLRKLFKSAQSRSPSIVVIDDIDVICPKRSQGQMGQQEHRIVGTLLSLLDNIASTQTPLQAVIVIGITNKKDNIDPALRRAGRFGCEVEVGVPTLAERREILEVLLSKVSHNLTREEIGTVARNAHGYVGADLCAVINEACMHSLSHSEVGASSHSAISLSMKDLVHAGLVTKPSALREIQLEIPEVKWTDIGGMAEVKMRLQEAVELPLNHPEVFKKLGMQPPKGLLMYGPPGCSKTMVARALATECKLNFLAVKGPELFNQYVGESEKAIREVFHKARLATPSIVFFDEIDAISAKRGSSGGGGSGVEDRVLTQLLTEMDGLEFLKDVFIVAATNRPDKIDRALLRPGRFDSLVYVPLPDAETRREILEKKFSRMCVADDVSLEFLVESTYNYSGAEIIQVCQEAALLALREDISARTVWTRHLHAALEKVRPQTDPELLQIYSQFSTFRNK